MKRILPPAISAARFDRALRAFARIVGDEYVLSTDEDRETYADVYAMGSGENHAPSAAVAPRNVEEIQAVLRVANEHRIPLWPISRGKNLGYGGAAPRMAGTVVLDLGRMKRIIEVDEKYGYCVLEPGVGFMDLHDYLEENGIQLELATPGNGWGSVVGNAMDRGFSGGGEHASNICGMEVVLPGGDVVRTGMGAMRGNRTWQLSQSGFGPSWDQMFVQSNYGIVTQMGLWMKPTPEAYIDVRLQLPRPEDIVWWTDAVTPLRIRGVLDGHVSVTSYQSAATTRSQRNEWYTGRDAIPDDVIDRIRQQYNVGWLNGGLRLSGYPEANEANLKIVRETFARHTSQELEAVRTTRQERRRNRPSVAALQIVNWHGGRGGHTSFSPIMPADGRLVYEQLQRTRALYQEFGIDYSATFYHHGRHVKNINLMLYDRDDADLTDRTRRLFSALIKASAEAGYGEYRTHLSYMDEVAGSFDFNGHALRRLNESVKDALDPNGILAPGKSGIWPRAYRKFRGIA